MPSQKQGRLPTLVLKLIFVTWWEVRSEHVYLKSSPQIACWLLGSPRDRVKLVYRFLGYKPTFTWGILGFTTHFLTIYDKSLGHLNKGVPIYIVQLVSRFQSRWIGTKGHHQRGEEAGEDALSQLSSDQFTLVAWVKGWKSTQLYIRDYFISIYKDPVIEPQAGFNGKGFWFPLLNFFVANLTWYFKSVYPPWN